MRVVPGKNGVNRFELVDKSESTKAKHIQELLKGPPDSDDEEGDHEGGHLAPKEKEQEGSVYIPQEIHEIVNYPPHIHLSYWNAPARFEVIGSWRSG